MARLFLIFIVTLPALISCKTVQDQSKTKSGSASYDTIITQCSVPEGNGGNWPATIGWLSETVHKRYLEAQTIAKTGKRVGVFLDCMAGSSSGSLATNILESVLYNKNLIARANPDGLLTVEQTKIVADSLRFIGLSANANLRELTNFYIGLGKSFMTGRITNRISKIPFLQNIARSVFDNQTPSWWSGQLANADQILVDFIVVSHLAKTLDLTTLYYPRNTGERPLVDFERYRSYSELENIGADQLEALTKSHYEIASKVEKKADSFVVKQFPLLAYKKRYLDGPYDKLHRTLKITALQPLSKGFCTLTIASFYDSLSAINLERAPSYDDVALGVFCDKHTISSIASSPFFVKDLTGNNYAKRYNYLATSNKRASMAVSLREPQLMAETSAKLSSVPFEVTDVLTSSSRDLLKPESRAGAILGGFSDRRLSAWPISYYYLNELARLESLTGDLRGYLELFGKPDNRAADTFSTTVIRTLLSADEQTADQNVEDWYAFQNTYCDLFKPRFDRFNVQIQTTALNWDVGKIPASQAGNSGILVKKGINAVSLQTQPEGSSYVFDPKLTGEFVPKRTFPCKSAPAQP